MARIELTDGLIAAAERELEFHPKASNKPITAWRRRQDTLLRHANAIEATEKKLKALEDTLASRPF